MTYSFIWRTWLRSRCPSTAFIADVTLAGHAPGGTVEGRLQVSIAQSIVHARLIGKRQINCGGRHVLTFHLASVGGRLFLIVCQQKYLVGAVRPPDWSGSEQCGRPDNAAPGVRAAR